MSTTPNTGITELSPAAANQAIAVNVGGYAIIDQLLVPVIVDKDLTAAPGSPADGTMYIMASAWSGITNAAAGRLVFWRSSSNNWTVIIPRVGWRVAVADELDANNVPKVYACVSSSTTSTWAIPESGLTNPMTTSGDVIYGGASGVPTRLARGSDGQVLTLASGVPSWAAASGGMANPMTAAGDLIYGGASGAPTRLSKGTDGYVLTLASGVPTWAASSGGGLTNWTEAISTASPNATIPVISFTVNGAATSIDVALAPKGNGGVSAHIADSTATGGNKRGSNAVDWQTSRNAAAQAATGGYSTIAGGYRNTASGNYAFTAGYQNVVSASEAVALGSGCTASGSNSVAIGYNSTASASWAMAFGATCVADGQYSLAAGNGSTARGILGVETRSSGTFGTQGDAQRSRHTLRRNTTDATASVLSSNASAGSSTNQVVLPNNSAYTFTIRLVARAASSADMASWEIKGSIKRGASASTTALVGTPASTSTGADSGASAWTVAVSADTTNGCLAVTVTGAAATSIKWVADVQTVEVVG